jgi:hypothetical protein
MAFFRSNRTGAKLPMKTQPVMFRQGDVLLIKVNSANGVQNLAKMPRVVLAYGEHTGHAHVLDSEKVLPLVRYRSAMPKEGEKQRQIWDAAAERYIQVLEQTTLDHRNLLKGDKLTGEHDSIALDPGTYRVIRQREATDEDDWRMVAD